MSWILNGFSNDIRIDSRDTSQHYLVFQKEDGTEVRLPVSEDIQKELIKLIYADKIQAPFEPPNPPRHTLEEDPIAEATEFGGDENTESEEEFETESPDSEEEVPSL